MGGDVGAREPRSDGRALSSCRRVADEPYMDAVKGRLGGGQRRQRGSFALPDVTITQLRKAQQKGPGLRLRR